MEIYLKPAKSHQTTPNHCREGPGKDETRDKSPCYDSNSTWYIIRFQWETNKNLDDLIEFASGSNSLPSGCEVKPDFPMPISYFPTKFEAGLNFVVLNPPAI
jgi:hypothetical protein